MILRLDISNYALVENVSLEFRPGFTVITGETGAGKSILLKALNLLLGERADTSVLRGNEKKCILEAEFDMSAMRIQDFFDRHDIDSENTCTIRREFNHTGKSRCFVNDSPVQLSVLAELGAKLINVHSQHDTLQILEPEFQLEQIDHFAGLVAETDAYRKLYRDYQQAKARLNRLTEQEESYRKERDYLDFLLREFVASDLESYVNDDTKSKFLRVELADRIEEVLSESREILDAEIGSPLRSLVKLISLLGRLRHVDPRYAALESRLQSVSLELKDISEEISTCAADVDFTAEEISIIRSRTESMNSLLFKHRVTNAEELIVLRDETLNRRGLIDSAAEELNESAKHMAVVRAELILLAQGLSAKRKQALPKLEKQVAKKLHSLGMPDAQLKISISSRDLPGPDGIDVVEFLFQTNAGGQFAPLNKIASGGELTRLMLGLISVLARSSSLPAMIFDEIDTGVSGETAGKVADEFASMGKHMQVVAITHLAQVAGRGDNHFHVSKKSTGGKTSTSVALLNETGRVDQLARMISGEKVSQAARDNARILLEFQGKSKSIQKG